MNSRPVVGVQFPEVCSSDQWGACVCWPYAAPWCGIEGAWRAKPLLLSS